MVARKTPTLPAASLILPIRNVLRPLDIFDELGVWEFSPITHADARLTRARARIYTIILPSSLREQKGKRKEELGKPTGHGNIACSGRIS